jgi:hypothetical protein
MSAERQLQEIIAAIAEARRAVAEGVFVEVSGLDAAVAAVCEAAPGLPVEERGAFAKRLSELAEALDELAADIVRQSEAAQRQRAKDAYGQEGRR